MVLRSVLGFRGLLVMVVTAVGGGCLDRSTGTVVTDDGTSDDRLEFACRFEIPYVEWGLRDPSTFVLRVAKKVGVTIDAQGTMMSTESETANGPED